MKPARAALRVGEIGPTVFQPIYETASGMDEERAGMFYGDVWKKGIIGRPEVCFGIRSETTRLERGSPLEEKTYFLHANEKHTADTHRPCN